MGLGGLQYRLGLICTDLCPFQVQLWLVRQTKGAPTACFGRRGMGSVSAHHTGVIFCYMHAHVWLCGLLSSLCSLLCDKRLVVQVTYLEPEVEFFSLLRWVLSILTVP